MRGLIIGCLELMYQELCSQVSSRDRTPERGREDSIRLDLIRIALIPEPHAPAFVDEFDAWIKAAFNDEMRGEITG